MNKILFASNNPGKIKEVKQILSSPGLQIVAPDQVFSSQIDVEETGSTFEENAYLKASQMGDKSGLITIADDSGLEVDALGGEPGVYSARYADSMDMRNQKVLKGLEGISEGKRTARFRIAVCIYDPKTKNHQIVEGSVEGKIAIKPEGNGGFGYDSIFYSHKLKKTFAQATSEEKNQISHRGIALKKVKKKFPEFLK